MTNAAKRPLLIALTSATAVLLVGLAVTGMLGSFLMLIGLTAIGIVLVDIPLILLISVLVKKTKTVKA